MPPHLTSLSTQHHLPRPLVMKCFATIFFFFATCFTLTAASSCSPQLHSCRTILLASKPNKLPHPVVIMISCDGFRFGYQYKTPTPNIQRLISQGTEAETGLIPVFPSLTFPNHYSIVTGLYPPYHGIISNSFKDPNTGDRFTQASHETKWWLGEPLWQTVVNHGLKASAYFWPGSEVHKGSWTCPSQFCQKYNQSVPFEERIDTLLSYFDLPKSEIPALMTLYLSDPDSQGHTFGPDHPQITDAVARIDKLVGRMIVGLEKRNIFEDVNLIMVGDHGMVGICDEKEIYLKELAPWIEIPDDWINLYTPLVSIRPPPNVSPADVVAKINEGLNSGKVGNGQYLKVYLKENLPSRFHYFDSDRIAPIIGLADEGYTLQMNKSESTGYCSGAHGYDNAFFSMRSIFIGHGPRFAKGKKVPSFENVQIYNLVTSILKIKGADNNGTSLFPQTVLKPPGY